MSQTERKSPIFKSVLDALLNQEKRFPPIFLHSFSDLDPISLNALRNIWPKIPLIRRQSLLEDLEELSDADSLTSFEEIARLAITDEDAKVRMMAIRLLWDVQDRQLVPTFIGMMEKDPDFEVRASAATALGIYVYLGEIEEIPASLLSTIENSVFKVINGTDKELVRRRALEALGFSSRSEVPTFIRNAYNHTQPEWIESSLFAMGRSADTVWEPDVLSQLENPHDSIRVEAIQAAGELEIQSARLPLLNILEDKPDNPDIWNATVWSLSQIGGDDVRVTLEELLENTEELDEIDYLEEALDNLTFTEDKALFNLLDIIPEEEENHIVDADGNLISLDVPDDLMKKKKRKNNNHLE
jgi:HEAT repeat protein